MTDSSSLQNSDVLAEMRQMVRDLQSDTLLMASAGMAIGGLLILLFLSKTPDPFWATTLCLASLLAAGLSSYIRRYNFMLASVIIITGSLVIVLGIVGWGEQPVALFLLIFPVYLATLTMGIWAGIGLAVVCIGILLSPLSFITTIDPIIRYITLICILGITGLTWITIRPLIMTVQWSWASYRKSQEALEQARQYQSQLHETVHDLTAVNLQLKQLNQLAQRLRQEAEEERRLKQEFVANVSHELRTPLNMIIGFCGMILDSPESYGKKIPPKLLADLDVVLRNSQHLSKLIDDVLDLSQIDVDRMALSMQRAELSNIIESAVIAVQPLYQSKNLYLKVQIEPDIPPIWCDHTRIREVLLNLLSNAGRFTDQGGVNIRAWREEAQVIVSVTDTGMGISEENKRRLFKPFQRLNGAIHRKDSGTGLGLSISKSLVELHHGKMWVESEVGRGTSFYFQLPIDPVDQPISSPVRWFNPYQPSDEYRSRLKIQTPEALPRILVVEKGFVLQKMLSRYSNRIEIVPAPSLEEALQQTSQTGTAALLINDIQFTETLKRLSHVHALPYSIPAVVCSIPDIGSISEEIGVANYLVKPIDREMMLKAIDQLGIPVETILIVDDENDARQLFHRLLSSARRNYRVLRAANGEEAIELMLHEKVDLVFLDLIMPGMDGFQFLERRSTLPSISQIPIILISARDPRGQPVVSNMLAITRGGGLSVQQVLNSIEALLTILSPIPPVSRPVSAETSPV